MLDVRFLLLAVVLCWPSVIRGQPSEEATKANGVETGVEKPAQPKCPLGEPCHKPTEVTRRIDGMSKSITDPELLQRMEDGDWEENERAFIQRMNAIKRTSKKSRMTSQPGSLKRRPGGGRKTTKPSKRKERRRRLRECRTQRRLRKLKSELRKRNKSNAIRDRKGGKGHRRGKAGKRRRRGRKCVRRKKGRPGKKNRRRKKEKKRDGEMNGGPGQGNRTPPGHDNDKRDGSAPPDIGEPAVGGNESIAWSDGAAAIRKAGASNKSQQGFDPQEITRLFRRSLESSDDGGRVVSLPVYVKAYEKLCGVFKFFGLVFSFAQKDLEKKLVILTELHDDNANATSGGAYDTFRNMFAHEYRTGVALPGRPETSGVRENAWIHRALKFIVAILGAITDDETDAGAPPPEPLSARVKQYYTDILAPYHSWMVRMGVYAAIYSFPSRQALLADMGVPDDTDGMRQLKELTAAIQDVYDVIQARYEEYAPAN